MKRLIYPLLCLLMPVAAAENAPRKYTDAAALTIVNKARPGGPAFQRLEVARYPELPPTVTKYFRYSTGLAVAFQTAEPSAHGGRPRKSCPAATTR